MNIHIDRDTVTINDLVITVGAHSRLQIGSVLVKAGPDGRVSAVDTDPLNSFATITRKDQR
ncbi:hypothetical protein AB0K52_22390 [Glycomyces sp. NPDC049804]|uniref:hypothetical protein n=1 Tax=Glycomyces sp. NPDC049804 TaxID=3154363 RepID=UPI00342F65EF